MFVKLRYLLELYMNVASPMVYWNYQIIFSFHMGFWKLYFVSYIYSLFVPWLLQMWFLIFLCAFVSQPPSDASYSFAPSPSCQDMVIMSLSSLLMQLNRDLRHFTSVQVPRNDVSGERPVQVESSFSARLGSAYPPAAPNSGLSDS